MAESWFVKILKSLGLKRKAASYVSALLEIVRAIPELGWAVAKLELLAGALGVVGTGHAAGAGTLSTQKLAGVASILAALIALAQFVPALAPYTALLQKIAALLGAGVFGANLAKK